MDVCISLDISKHRYVCMYLVHYKPNFVRNIVRLENKRLQL